MGTSSPRSSSYILYPGWKSSIIDFSYYPSHLLFLFHQHLLNFQESQQGISCSFGLDFLSLHSPFVQINHLVIYVLVCVYPTLKFLGFLITLN